MTDAEKITFLKNFSHTESGDVKRNKFVLFAKKGSSESSTYEAIGYKQESAAIANNYDTTELTDILGTKYKEINDKSESIEMSEYHINKDKSAFLDEAFKYTIAGLENQLNDYDLLMVFSWLVDSSGKMLARHITDCTLTLDNLGGQAYTMADVTFSGISDGEYGTVASLDNPTFTPGTATE